VIEETYVVAIDTHKGSRRAARKPLKVPLAIATGDYEDLSNRALRDHIKDCVHEWMRRQTQTDCPEAPSWDPELTQIRRLIDV